MTPKAGWGPCVLKAMEVRFGLKSSVAISATGAVVFPTWYQLLHQRLVRAFCNDAVVCWAVSHSSGEIAGDVSFWEAECSGWRAELSTGGGV